MGHPASIRSSTAVRRQGPALSAAIAAVRLATQGQAAYVDAGTRPFNCRVADRCRRAAAQALGLSMNKLMGAIAALALTSAAGGAHATTQVVYQTDFTTASTAAGVTATTAGSGGALENVGTGIVGFYAGDVFRNNSGGTPVGTSGGLSTWSLTGLGAHDHLTVSFTAAMLDSWDSTDGARAPDYYNIYLDGVLTLQLTSVAASGTVTDLGGGTQVALGDFFNTSGTYYSQDRIVDMSTASSLTFAHTGSSFVLGISGGGGGWQGGDDESWGIDNLSVTSNLSSLVGGVPEPAIWALLTGGFGMVGAMLRRQRIRTV